MKTTKSKIKILSNLIHKKLDYSIFTLIITLFLILFFLLSIYIINHKIFNYITISNEEITSYLTVIQLGIVFYGVVLATKTLNDQIKKFKIDNTAIIKYIGNKNESIPVNIVTKSKTNKKLCEIFFDFELKNESNYRTLIKITDSEISTEEKNNPGNFNSHKDKNFIRLDGYYINKGSTISGRINLFGNNFDIVEKSCRAYLSFNIETNTNGVKNNFILTFIHRQDNKKGYSEVLFLGIDLGISN